MRIQKITILEEEVCPDHVHTLLEIPPKISVSSFVGYLKGKSSLLVYQKWGNLKYKYRNREFQCRGYYVDITGKTTKRIAEYIKNQLKEDQDMSNLQLIFDEDPFKGQLVIDAGVGLHIRHGMSLSVNYGKARIGKTTRLSSGLLFCLIFIIFQHENWLTFRYFLLKIVKKFKGG